MKDAPRHVVVFCPLAHEGSVIARHLRRLGSSASVVILGTDPGSIRTKLNDRSRTAPAAGSRLFLLAGLAGGLTQCPDCPPIAAVLDAQTGASWTPHLQPAPGEPAVTLLGATRPLLTTDEKHQWHERTGAALVDTESHIFAATCEELGVPWAVARGVSDTHDECLPAAVANWIDNRGKTRFGRICLDAVLHPALVSVAMRLGRRSGRVLPLVAQRVETLARSVPQLQASHG